MKTGVTNFDHMQRARDVKEKGQEDAIRQLSGQYELLSNTKVAMRKSSKQTCIKLKCTLLRHKLRIFAKTSISMCLTIKIIGVVP